MIQGIKKVFVLGCVYVSLISVENQYTAHAAPRYREQGGQRDMEKFVNYYKPHNVNNGDVVYEKRQWITPYPKWKPSTAAPEAPEQQKPTKTSAQEPPKDTKMYTRKSLVRKPQSPTTKYNIPRPSKTRTPSGGSGGRPTGTPKPPQGGGGGSGSGESAGVGGIDCSKFSSAVTAAGYPQPSSDQCNSFLNGLTRVGGITSSTEAAMFLSQILWESDGLRAKSEYLCQTSLEQCKSAYGSSSDLPGKVYFGRGYIQLTWADNYISASQGLYGDDRLLKNPESVSSNEQTAWDVSFWYWSSRVRPTPGVTDQFQFGSSTKAINGALECSGGGSDKPRKRYEIYKKVLGVFNPSATPNESGCYN
ncbi:hypothetical protein BB560_003741 [Smittium megazygosporum]|uniref:Glycoside hydrolase family 19 catalytic domain-containing protein n=1 Tax=Smittium megazygosporum TaxID=133381 RepID=A0A2T9ZB77_9FUNG|nr:hypothetical protein BB560_003741 [Smittium megazygosporum]